MARLILLTLAIILIYGQTQICKSEDVFGKESLDYAKNAIEFGQRLSERINKYYNMRQSIEDKNINIKLNPEINKSIDYEMEDIVRHLGSLRFDSKEEKDLLKDIYTSEHTSIKNNLFEIYSSIHQIENLYENFFNYIKSPNSFSASTLLDFANYATSHDFKELPNLLKIIHSLLIQTDVNLGDSILTALSKDTQESNRGCKRQQSFHQMLYNIYNTIAIADVKGYAMIQFSYNLLKMKTEGNFSAEIELAEQQFVKRITHTMAHVRKAISHASRLVWKCDDDNHKEGVTYTKLNKLFQKYIINEADLSPSGTCKKTCRYYSKARPFGCYDGMICAQQRTCHGTLWDCEYAIDSTMSICPSDRNSSRRYEYIEYEDNKSYGKKKNCNNALTVASSWIRIFVSCSYCMCTCDDWKNTNSDRYVNLREVLTDKRFSYVVTGVRFKKVNHIIHIQLQQGKLLPGGIINQTTVHWKPIESYKLNESLPNSIETKWEYIPQESIDYHVLEWKVERGKYLEDSMIYTKAAVNLDDLDFTGGSNGNYLVTGMKFSVNEVQGSGYHLNLELQMTAFNFTTGKLNLDSSLWYSAYKNLESREYLVSKNMKTKLNLENLNVPTTKETQTVPVSQDNQYLYFTTSSLETDAGQSTIPFIDLQSVETHPAAPLSGLGLFYKSVPGFNGFLSFKLFTYNYEPHLRV